VLLTPLRHSPWLSSVSGATVFLKLETLQPTFSYKIRGATNAVLRHAESRTAAPLVTASAGNHGRAMAHAARAASVPLTVFAPRTAPRTKLDAISHEGARLELCASYDDAERMAKAAAARGEGVYISPYSHRDVIAGAGTIGLEILDDMPGVEVIIAAIGGGGLASGVAIAADGRADVAAVEVAASAPFTASLAAGRIVEIDVRPTLADGLAGNLDPDTLTFDIIRQLGVRIAVVEEDDLARAVGAIVREERLVAEGAAAAAIAGVIGGALPLQGKQVAVILSGANIDPEKLRRLI
jgi:threonine dehydratase